MTLRLNDRDQLILRDVGHFRYLTVRQVTRLLQAPGSYTTINARMKLLAEDGWLLRPSLPYRPGGGKFEYFYTLGARGRRFCLEEGREIGTRTKDVDFHHLNHTQLVNDLLIAGVLLAEEKTPALTLDPLVPEWQFRSHPFALGELGFLAPDGLLFFTQSTTPHPFFVEVDMGNEGLKVWAQKAAKYTLYVQRFFQDTFATTASPLILVLSLTEGRQTTLEDWVGTSVPPEILPLFRFSTIDPTGEPKEVFCSPAWKRAGRGYLEPLLALGGGHA